MDEALRVHCPARWFTHRLCALAVLALTACKAAPEERIIGPNCLVCYDQPAPPIATHHGIVRGVVRDAAGAPVVGAWVTIGAWGGTFLVDLTSLDGDGPVPADGSFRMRYTIGVSGAPPDSAIVRVSATRPTDGSRVEVRLPTPRPLSAPADSVTLTLVLPP